MARQSLVRHLVQRQKNYKSAEVAQMRNTSSPTNSEVQLKDAVIDKVLEAHDIEVPQALVDEEVRMMVFELNHRMKYEGLATGTYLSLTQDEIAVRLEIFKKEAFKLVKTRLVLRSIIESAKLDVTEEELEEEAKAISVRQQMPIEMVKDFLGEDLEPLRDDLLVRKAIAFIIANA
jgi:FKBP-type peptidyl-prolyl cis-trans isomerase (trigger factor)